MTLFHKTLAAALGAAIYVAVAYRIASGVTAAERIDVEGDPSDFRRPFERVRFAPRRSNLFLDGWYLPGRADMPTVIFVHGISSNRTGGGATTELAAMLNLSDETMIGIFTGAHPITPEIAAGLQDVLWIPAEFWLNLEAHYRETLARIAANQKGKSDIPAKPVAVDIAAD